MHWGRKAQHRLLVAGKGSLDPLGNATLHNKWIDGRLAGRAFCTGILESRTLASSTHTRHQLKKRHTTHGSQDISSGWADLCGHVTYL